MVPDILANAGGVVASYDEWRAAKSGSRAKKEETYRTIESALGDAYESVIRRALSAKAGGGCPHRSGGLP